MYFSRKAQYLSIAAALIVAPLIAASQAVLSKPAKNAKLIKVENNQAFHALLLDIAATYVPYGHVDDIARIAPALCAMAQPPSKPKLSKSTDESTHGGKLYYLFAKDKDAYLKFEEPLGQVIVKEAWFPKATTVDQKPDDSHVEIPGWHPTDLNDPGVSTKQGLFVMTKLDPKTPGTDEGWVYGTITPDGKTITSAGRVQSCMSCHTSAPHGRMFGLAKTSAAIDPVSTH
jgi:hypothetical protein